MPETKLTTPNATINTMNPTCPSERCGVITAEKIVGSRPPALSLLMLVTIPQPQSWRKSRPASLWRGPALDQCPDRGGVPPFPGRQPRTEGRATAHQPLHAARGGDVVGAGDRCRRQQGDTGAVQARRHAWEDGGAWRGARAQ